MPCLSEIFEGVQHLSCGSGAETKSLAPDLVLGPSSPFLEPGYSCLPPGALPAACGPCGLSKGPAVRQTIWSSPGPLLLFGRPELPCVYRFPSTPSGAAG